jgi:hypothetical protein
MTLRVTADRDRRWPRRFRAMQQPPRIRGAEAVVAWWGSWISFHDFYLLSLPQPFATEGEMRIHGWVTHPETDDRGYFKQSRHCVVRLQLAGIRDRDISISSDEQNELPAIIGALEVEQLPDGWTLTWDSSYGCAGTIEAASASIVLEPGHPGTGD